MSTGWPAQRVRAKTHPFTPLKLKDLTLFQGRALSAAEGIGNRSRPWIKRNMGGLVKRRLFCICLLCVLFVVSHMYITAFVWLFGFLLLFWPLWLCLKTLFLSPHLKNGLCLSVWRRALGRSLEEQRVKWTRILWHLSICARMSNKYSIRHYSYLVISTNLKNMLVKLNHLSPKRGENTHRG